MKQTTDLEQEAFICVNCKEIYGNKPKQCHCGGKTFEPTHPSNLNQTSISNDSLEDKKIVAETTEYIDFANAFNDSPNTKTMAAFIESKYEDMKLCLVFGREPKQVNDRMNLICEAVNNYNALKSVNKELIEALDLLYNQDFSGFAKKQDVVGFVAVTVSQALAKAKQL